MKGFILINAYTQSESELYQPRRLREELQKLNVTVDLVRNVCVDTRVDYDFCVYLDKDKYGARLLEGQGLRLFNRAAAIETCDDKMLTCLALQGFPVPETFSAPLCYTPEEEVSERLLARAEERLGYPLVVKECYGSLGKGVYFIENRVQLLEICKKLQCKPHLFQKFIHTSYGTDVRVIVIGGKARCAMKRTGQGFLSNVAAGGAGEPFPLDRQTAALCEDVSRRLGLDYCGIDLLFGESGFLICEVNSNAFFAAAERVTGINVAKIYAEHIFEQIYDKEKSPL